MAIWHVAPLRFAPAFRELGVCEHIWPRYKNFDPSCFDPIQKFGMSTWGLTLIFDPVPSTYFRPPGCRYPYMSLKWIRSKTLDPMHSKKTCLLFSTWYMPFLPNPILPNPTLPKAWDISSIFSAIWASNFSKVDKAVVYICKNRLQKL